MYKLAIMLAIAALGCRSPNLVSIPESKCDKPCYGSDAGTPGKGICALGTWKCKDYYDESPVCTGWVGPKEVECNKLDNNCDGKIDSTWRECSNACGKSTQFCIEGVWTVCPIQEVRTEVCNNYDDDCNGLIDDVAFSTPFCYSGPTSSIAKGECRPGFSRCYNGIQECTGEVLPKPELCDGLDNDCNGTVDNGTTPQPKDIVVCVDESGSMDTKIAKVRIVANSWTTKFAGRTDLKFALLSCPGRLPEEDAQVVMRTNLTDVAAFNVEVSKLLAGNSGYFEPLIDAVYMTANPANPLRLNWTPGAKRIMIVIGDEEAQSGFLVPPVTAWQTGINAVNAGLTVYGFIDLQYSSHYVPMVIPTGGKLFSILSSFSQMESDLDSIVNQCN